MTYKNVLSNLTLNSVFSHCLVLQWIPPNVGKQGYSPTVPTLSEIHWYMRIIILYVIAYTRGGEPIRHACQRWHIDQISTAREKIKIIKNDAIYKVLIITVIKNSKKQIIYI